MDPSDALTALLRGLDPNLLTLVLPGSILTKCVVDLLRSTLLVGRHGNVLQTAAFLVAVPITTLLAWGEHQWPVGSGVPPFGAVFAPYGGVPPEPWSLHAFFALAVTVLLVALGALGVHEVSQDRNPK